MKASPLKKVVNRKDDRIKVKKSWQTNFNQDYNTSPRKARNQISPRKRADGGLQNCNSNLTDMNYSAGNGYLRTLD